MTPDTQLLDPKLLGFWVRVLRTSASLSQEALATVSNLTVRTIQRVEAGARANLTTRRCLARGLGYDNPDIFDDPEFVSTVTSLMNSIAAQRDKEEEARHPDHFKLEVTHIGNGSALATLIDGSEAWSFQCDDALAEAARQEIACFFDNLRDYGDIWPELSHSDRFEAEKYFDELLKTLANLGASVFGGRRERRFVGKNWPDKTPIAFMIAYVAIVAVDQKITHIMVPRKGRMG